MVLSLSFVTTVYFYANVIYATLHAIVTIIQISTTYSRKSVFLFYPAHGHSLKFEMEIRRKFCLVSNFKP